MNRVLPRAALWLLALAGLTASPTVMAAPPARDLLRDPSPAVRLRAAMALAESNDAEAVPVLIDLLAELPSEQRRPAEEFLTQFAGEWAPVLQFAAEDHVSRRIRRDAWSGWWRHTDGPVLLAVIRKHTLTPEARVRVNGLIAKLGDREFAARENAARELSAVGRIALPPLREAVKGKDPEIARRAKELVERIEREPANHLPVAALRLLAVRKPAGAAEALLAYLPHAEDESRVEEVRKSLTALALTDGKPVPALLRALTEGTPPLRAVAAQALARGGGAAGRAAVRARLKDEVPVVQVRAALALASAGEKEAVPVLIDLLTVLPRDQLGEVEAALYQLAGETAPAVSSEDGEKYRGAWAAWWKANSQRVDLGRLTDQAQLGYTLICDVRFDRVYEIDRHGKQRWAIDQVRGPFDAVVLPGDRVLIAEFHARRITERDFKGDILWQKEMPGQPSNVQRLPNGNTLVALNGKAILELDRFGKEVYSIPHVDGGTLAANRTPQGPIVCTTANGWCLVLDTTGKQLKQFRTGHDCNSFGAVDLRPNGNILIAWWNAGRVMEFDRDGKKLLDLNAPAAQTASALPNGHILVAATNGQCVYELDRAGKVVWEHKREGGPSRARRR